MRVKDIASTYNVDPAKFTNYLKSHGLGKSTLSGYLLEDNIPETVEKYKAELEEKKKAEEERKEKERLEEQKRMELAAEAERQKREAEEQKQRALASMLITSGFNFDGYTVVKYSGYISGDDCITIPRDNFWGSNKVPDNLCNSLVKIRRQAIKELKEAAYNLGCNAVIGVDFDYMTMDPQHSAPLNGQITVYEPYVICVTANGNAVVVEKNTKTSSVNADELREYKALLDEGVITQAEFDAKKKELL